MAFKSIQTHVSDGTLQSVQFDIDFLSTSHLHFYVDNVEITTSIASQGVAVDGVDAYGVTLTAAVPSGAVFKVQRQTPRENVPHVFATGAALFTALTTDANNEYLLYVVQETYEQSGQGPFPTITALAGTEYVVVETGGVRKQITTQDFLGSVPGVPQVLADLANTTDPAKGAALVGGACRVVDTYDNLRIFGDTDGVTVIDVTGTLATASPSGISGRFIYDSTDTTTADDGGVCIVTSSGKRFKRVNAYPRNVAWYGAKLDGVTDDTAAVNAATKATQVWDSSLEYNVYIPHGRCKLNGTIYVRKGQTIFGEGHGTYIDFTGNTDAKGFVLGQGLISGVETNDPGGSPVKISNMWTVGGSGSNGTICVRAAGFSITDMFMTGPGIGLDLHESADGIISNIEIDQSLSAILMGETQNMVFTNISMYVPSYAVTFGSACRDIVFNNLIVSYPRYTGVYFSDSSSSIKNIEFNNIKLLLNEQYTTFLGGVYSRATDVDAQFTGGSFRNWPGYAVKHDAGTNNSFVFTGTVFDGDKTTSAYAQSTTAKGVFTGFNDKFTFTGCEFKNLHGELFALNNGLTRLSMVGGLVTNCPINRFAINSQNLGDISVSLVDGFAYVSSSSTHQYIVLPYFVNGKCWEVTVTGNLFAPGNGNYRCSEGGIYSVTMQYDGEVKMFADKMKLWGTPSRVLPGAMAAQVCIGDNPTGPTTTTTITENGLMCVFVPIAEANATDSFKWTCSTK